VCQSNNVFNVFLYFAISDLLSREIRGLLHQSYIMLRSWRIYGLFIRSSPVFDGTKSNIGQQYRAIGSAITAMRFNGLMPICYWLLSFALPVQQRLTFPLFTTREEIMKRSNGRSIMSPLDRKPRSSCHTVGEMLGLTLSFLHHVVYFSSPLSVIEIKGHIPFCTVRTCCTESRPCHDQASLQPSIPRT